MNGQETKIRLFQYSDNRDLTNAVVKRVESRDESEKYLEEECLAAISNWLDVAREQ